MRNSDTTPIIVWRDVPAALGLLTRLPVRVDMDRAVARGAAGAWAYPLVGLVVGGIAACTAVAALALGLGPDQAALLAVAVPVVITGALHEDGLADSADGLWGGWDPARRLHIMKDSHIGAYGVIAIVLVMLMRWVLIAGLLAAGHIMPLVVAAMLSRASMIGVMAWLPNARKSGLSQSVGRPALRTVILATLIAGFAALVLSGMAGLLAIITAGLLAAGCGIIARAKIGGQTGDVLGAVQQISDLGVLMCLSAALAA
jgi:adenosylcobinamide-GDP ribazoletransferase